MKSRDFRLKLYSHYEQKKNWEVTKIRSEYPDLYQHEFARLDLIGSLNIFEVGFGDCDFMLWAREMGHQVFGVEINTSLVESARKIGLDVECADAITYVSSYTGARIYDVVTLFDVLEHQTMDEMVELMSNLSRLVKKGGLVLIRVPNGQSPFGCLHQYGDATHISVLSGPILFDIARGLGLTPIKYYNSARRRPGNEALYKRIARELAYILRNGLEVILGKLYLARRVPMDPSVTVILRIP